MSQTPLRIRLGLFVLMAGLLLATLILLFGSLPSLFKRTTMYSIRFTDAPGLTAGAPVRRSGVRIGEVRRIALDDERGIVIVTIAIDAPYVIRKSDQPTLVTGLLGGDTSIDFIPRPVEDLEPGDRVEVASGAELSGVRQTTVNTLLKGASDMVPTTQETLVEIRKSIASVEKLARALDKTVPSAERAIEEYRQLAVQARGTIPQLEKTNAEAQGLIRSVRESVPEAQRVLDEYRLLARDARAAIPIVQKTAEEVNRLSRDVRGSLPEIQKTAREVSEFVRSARAALPNVERTIEEIRDLSSAIRKEVPRVAGVIDDAGAATRTAGKFIEDVRNDYLKNRDSIENSIKKFEQVMGQVASLVTEENVSRVRGILTNTRQASEQFPKIAQNVADLTDQAKGTMKQIESTLKDAQGISGDLRKVSSDVLILTRDLQKITSPLAERADRIIRNVDDATDRVNLILGDVRALLNALDKSDGTLRKVLTDPAIYNNIDAATAGVVRLLPRIDRILKDFETFADKLARHPESIGIGGVVRPGSGLKTPATPPMNQGPPVITTPVHMPGTVPPGFSPSYKPQR